VVTGFFLVSLLALSTPPATPVEIRIHAEEEAFTAVVSGPKGSATAGAFSGTVALNGSATEIPVAGNATAAGDRLEITMRSRYHDLPEDWVSRFRFGDFDFRLRGKTAGGGAVDWAGTKAWSEVHVDGREDLSSKFVRLGTIELTEFTFLSSAARAQVVVRNPLAFPLKIVTSTYRAFANGREVGSGATGEMSVAAGRETTLNLPIGLDHGQLLAAAGSALASGGDVAGRLNGTLVLRLKTSDVPVPLDLSGRFSALR